MNEEQYIERKDEPFGAHTPLRCGGKAKRWIWVYSEDALKETVLHLKQHREPWIVHWPFQDILCKNGGYEGTVIRLAGSFSRISYHQESVVLGSAALWSQLTLGYDRAFGLWSGSVGGLFAQKEEALLNSHPIKLRWLRGKKIIEEEVQPKQSSLWNKKNCVLLSIEIFGSPRKRKFLPTKSGMIYKTAAKIDVKDVFQKHQLTGIRLKDWLLCRQSPGRILQLGSGSTKELLLLSQGIKERIKKIGGNSIALRIPLIGKENKIDV